MWMRRLFSKLNRWAALKEVDPDDPLSSIRIALETFDPKLFVKLDVAVACVVKFECDYPNITEVIAAVKRMLYADYSQSKIDPTYLGLQRREITLESFFYDAKGVRIPHETNVSKFREVALELLVVYEEKLKNQQTGITGYNSRLIYAQLIQLGRLADLLRTNS